MAALCFVPGSRSPLLLTTTEISAQGPSAGGALLNVAGTATGGGGNRFAPVASTAPGVKVAASMVQTWKYIGILYCSKSTRDKADAWNAYHN